MMDRKIFRIYYVPNLNLRVSFIETFVVNNIEFMRYKIRAEDKIRTKKIKVGSKYSYIGNIKIKNEIINFYKENLK